MAIQYTRKPVIIEAVKWTGENGAELEEFCGYNTLGEGYIGYYVVKNEKGRFEVFSESAFNETFKRHLVWEDNI
jgi:hypothetical protein